MVELLLLVPQDCVEPASDALVDEFEALSVSIEDADADTGLERAVFGEPGMPLEHAAWPRSALRALFASEEAASDAVTRLLAQTWGDRIRVESLRPVAEQDWVRLTQSQFAPVSITPEFWIVPSWHEPPAAATRTIRLDPGLAFGTGTHPTTRMCLRWIARRSRELALPWARVLDYGCGSGVLAIAAMLHGALAVDAVDIDPAAVQATADNAQANGVSLNTGLPDAASGTYALVLGNILANSLKLLAPLLSRHVAADDGELVLAGILERQGDELRAAYAPWLNLQTSDADEGWILMTARRSRCGT
jgi:ribosomal protein L11 methyltransferase